MQDFFQFHFIQESEIIPYSPHPPFFIFHYTHFLLYEIVGKIAPFRMEVKSFLLSR